MSIEKREKLKKYFKTGAKPTEEEFADLVDSFHHAEEDGLHLIENEVGIGTKTPDSPLTVQCDDENGNLVSFKSKSDQSQWQMRLTPDGDLGVVAAQKDECRLSLKKNGDLGVGTESPKGRLDVHGDLKISGTPPLMIKTFSQEGHVDTGMPYDEWEAFISFEMKRLDVRDYYYELRALELYEKEKSWHLFSDIQAIGEGLVSENGGNRMERIKKRKERGGRSSATDDENSRHAREMDGNWSIKVLFIKKGGLL